MYGNPQYVSLCCLMLANFLSRNLKALLPQERVFDVLGTKSLHQMKRLSLIQKLNTRLFGSFNRTLKLGLEHSPKLIVYCCFILTECAY